MGKDDVSFQQSVDGVGEPTRDARTLIQLVIGGLPVHSSTGDTPADVRSTYIKLDQPAVDVLVNHTPTVCTGASDVIAQPGASNKAI